MKNLFWSLGLVFCSISICNAQKVFVLNKTLLRKGSSILDLWQYVDNKGVLGVDCDKKGVPELRC